MHVFVDDDVDQYMKDSVEIAKKNPDTTNDTTSTQRVQPIATQQEDFVLETQLKQPPLRLSLRIDDQ